MSAGRALRLALPMRLLRASRLRLHFGPFLVLAAISLFAAGCGDSKQGRLLSSSQASELRGTLSQIQQDVAADNCTDAKQQVAALEEEIDAIKRLDRDLRSALRSSTRRLETLVSDKCAPATTTTPTETTPTTPDEGTTGGSGATGATGEGKKPKKEKPPKKTPPGQDENGPPGQQGGGGGAGIPGESFPNETGGD
jgi:TolA-binding protein